MTNGEGQHSEAFGEIGLLLFALSFNLPAVPLEGLIIFCQHSTLTIIIVTALRLLPFFHKASCNPRLETIIVEPFIDLSLQSHLKEP